MDVWEHEGRTFEVAMASDVINHGMILELMDLGSAASGPVHEAFWHDDGGGFDLRWHGAVTLSFAVVERFLNEARRVLPSP